MTETLTTIGFDADDTLWHNMKFYDLTEARFAALLKDYAEPQDLAQRLLAAERKNLKLYGFGIKGFTLSMIETAIEVTEGKVPASVVGDMQNTASGVAAWLGPVAERALAGRGSRQRLGDLRTVARRVERARANLSGQAAANGFETEPSAL